MGQIVAVWTRLTVSSVLVEEIVRHLREALPNEGCGLLAGVPDGATLNARRYYPGTNRHSSPSRFEMRPEEVASALVAMTDSGLSLIGIVHSHPRTAAEPSATDLAEAYYPEAALVIVSFAASLPVIRAWRIADVPDGRPVVELPVTQTGP